MKNLLIKRIVTKVLEIRTLKIEAKLLNAIQRLDGAIPSVEALGEHLKEKCDPGRGMVDYIWKGRQILHVEARQIGDFKLVENPWAVKLPDPPEFVNFDADLIDIARKIQQHRSKAIEMALIGVLERIEGRVPSMDEILKHMEVLSTRDGVDTYVWHGLNILETRTLPNGNTLVKHI